MFTCKLLKDRWDRGVSDSALQLAEATYDDNGDVNPGTTSFPDRVGKRCCIGQLMIDLGVPEDKVKGECSVYGLGQNIDLPELIDEVETMSWLDLYEINDKAGMADDVRIRSLNQKCHDEELPFRFELED